VYRQALPAVTFVTAPSPSAAASVDAVQSGDADVSFAFADDVYFSYVGRPGSGRAPYDQLRVIADLGATPVQLLVRRGLRLGSIRDLRGLRVSIGLPNNATEVTVDLLLRAFGMQVADIVAEHLPTPEAGVRLANGTLDAMFSTTMYPADALRVATRGGARLVPLTGPPIDRLRAAYPFFRVAMIPRLAYPELDHDVLTVGVNSVLICRRDLDERLVYDLTRIFFDSLPALSSATALRMMDVERAAAAPIPLHDGAARYYREQEVMR
jgi:uncharacterized protein